MSGLPQRHKARGSVPFTALGCKLTLKMACNIKAITSFPLYFSPLISGQKVSDNKIKAANNIKREKGVEKTVSMIFNPQTELENTVSLMFH